MKPLLRRLGVYLLAFVSFVHLDLWVQAAIAALLALLDTILVLICKWLKIGRDEGGIG
jgi:hypothetical protein